MSDFIKTYKEDENSKIKEQENEVIMETHQDKQKQTKKMLYIDKKTAKPTKLEVIDKNQKTLVYILYKEIKINSSR